MRYDVNISILFPDLLLADRPAAAAAAGFDAAESWWPFDVPVPPSRQVDDFVAAFAATDVRLIMLNLDLGDAAAGQHGLLGVADGRQRFRDNLDVVVEIVRRLRVRVVNSHFGNTGEATPSAGPFELAIDNLSYAAALLSKAGAQVVVEALNATDFPRYGLRRTADAAELAHAATRSGGVEVKILYDLCHVQRSEGDLIARARTHIDAIGHIQVADAPARSRPGTGEIAVERVLKEFDRLGYDGYAGLEYHPDPDPSQTFAWLDPSARPSASGSDA